MQDMKENVNLNGKSSEGYDDINGVYSLCLIESGKYAYAYKDNSNINNKIYGEYDFLYIDGGDPFVFDEDGTFGFRYYRHGTSYNKTNDKEEIVPLEDANIELYSTSKEHTLYSSYEYDFVVINGERYGKSPAIHAWYDKAKNAFVWNGIEGKELALYEYRLD